MMTSRSKIQGELKNGHLLPISEHDASQIESLKNGQAFDLTVTGKRSNPQHNLYWSTLKKVCDATGKWPTDKHLHNDLKWACGYVKLRYNNLTGSHMRIVDSINFNEMDQSEFNLYFELAMAKLSEATGYDPLQTT